MSKLLPLAVLGMALTAMASNVLATGAPSDPMRPDYAGNAHSAPRTPHWYLSSTLVSPQRRFAIINGQSVGVGDWVNGARVLEILPYAVKLKHDDKVLTVYLVSQDVKRHGEN